MYDPTELQAFIRHATDEQITASWLREQEWRKAHGLAYYERLIEPLTGRVLAEVAP